MHIDRRSVIKQLLIISAGAAILPGCVNDKKPAPYAFGNLPVTAKEEEMLAELSATIIPTNDTPGAKEAGAHLFALRMLNDCYKKEDREKFVSGFKQFQDSVKQQYNKTYTQCSAAERTQIVTKAATRKDAGDDAAYFFNTFKRLTIQAYTSSEYYLTNVEVYKLVPGKFISSVKVSPLP
jgi:hypothetical protein